MSSELSRDHPFSLCPNPLPKPLFIPMLLKWGDFLFSITSYQKKKAIKYQYWLKLLQQTISSQILYIICMTWGQTSPRGVSRRGQASRLAQHTSFPKPSVEVMLLTSPTLHPKQQPEVSSFCSSELSHSDNTRVMSREASQDPMGRTESSSRGREKAAKGSEPSQIHVHGTQGTSTPDMFNLSLKDTGSFF